MIRAVYQFFLCFLIAGLLLISCISADSKNSPKLADYNENLLQLAKLIDEEVGDGSANHLQQCAVILFGNKPCGGPWGYLVYSELISDSEILISLNETYSYYEGIRNEKEGLFSTCEMPVMPELKIKDGACYGLYGSAINPGELLDREKRINSKND